VPRVVDSSGSETEVEPEFVRESSELAQYGSDSSIESNVGRNRRMSTRGTEIKDSGLGQGVGAGMSDFMRIFLEDQARREEKENRRREDERREREEEMLRREEAEVLRRETEAKTNLALQQQLIETLMEKRAAPMHTPPTPPVNLPRMREVDELEEFVSVFETALKVNEVPRGLWKAKLISHLPLKALVKIDGTLQVEGSSSYDVVGALRGSNTMSFCNAAEDLCSGERGRVFELEVRPRLSRLKHLVKVVAGEAESVDQMAEAIAVALARDRLVPALKTYVDTGRRFGYREFVETCEKWERSKPQGTPCFRRNRSSVAVQGRAQGSSQPHTVKKTYNLLQLWQGGPHG